MKDRPYTEPETEKGRIVAGLENPPDAHLVQARKISYELEQHFKMLELQIRSIDRRLKAIEFGMLLVAIAVVYLASR